MRTRAIARAIDRASFCFVLGMIALHGIAAAYYLKSALGIDLLEGPSILHPLFFD
jgi:hypothetical protein